MNTAALSGFSELDDGDFIDQSDYNYKTLQFFISVEQTKLSMYHEILYILSSHTHQFSFLDTVKFTV